MNTKLIIHIVISLISLSGLIVYYYAFLLGYKKHNSQLKKQSKLPEKLYFMSTYLHIPEHTRSLSGSL